MIKRYSLGILCLITHCVQGAGTLTFGQFQRLNTPLDGEVDNSFVQFDLNERREKGRWDVVLNGSLRKYTGDRGLLYAMPEAYISRYIGRSEFTLGRKVVNWNSNDEFWAMGEINSLKNFNLLETQREGIFGLHLHRRYKKWDFLFLASMVNIPQVNPTFKAEGGEINGVNEWSNLPPQFVRFRGEDVPVFYDIIYPEVADIALQETIAFKVDYKGENTGINLYGGRKPEPGIRITATGYYEQEFGGRAVVQAKPFINHHNFWGVGVNYFFEGRQSERGLSLHGAVDGIVPDRGRDTIFDQFETLKIQPVYDRITYATASLKWKRDFFEASVNGLYLIDGDKFDDNVFAKKPRWRQAVGANFSWNYSDRLRLHADYKYDVKMSDIAFIAGTSFDFTKHIRLGLKAQIIKSPNESSFWASYRANDAFLGEMSYRF
jgi:hypothetical protein